MRPERRLLRFCIAITCVSLVAAILHTPPILRIIFALPLVFVLPGTAMLRALNLRFPPAAHGTLAVGISMAITVLGGLALNCIGGLTPFGWAACLGGVSTLAAAAANRSEGRIESMGTRVTFPAMRRRHGVMLAATAAMLMLTLQGALHAAAAINPFPHTSFWMLPVTQASTVYMIGIKNDEGRPESYAVQLMVGQRITGEWQDLVLAPGQSLTYPVMVQAGVPAQAWLYRSEQPQAIYRRVTIAGNNNIDGAAVSDAVDVGQ